MGKRKLVWVLLLVVALGLFAAFMLRHANSPGSATGVRLPDGSWFRLGKIQFNSSNHFFQAQGATGWKARIAKVLPTSLAARLGISPFGGAINIGGGLGTNLAVSTILAGSINCPHTALRLVVSDELGNSFENDAMHGVVSSSDGKNQMRMDVWNPGAFPRRGKQLRLSYYDSLLSGY